ncbi:two component sigma54 specific transcriptional regulator Fis family [gamma proteobacterium IMCC1989]|nr:two component sigma54 specific transcriptional regulator Fis family [gamma proteobacterium IMCC1989]
MVNGINESLALMNIIGESPAIKKVRFLISTHGRYDAPVLVTGETGTGKELAARGLHYSGSRASQPFIAINCATLTDDLFMSELFGHMKGSFTDAKKDKKGLLATANKGTLFLDEIDSLSLKSQAALLRFLQEKEYRPVGSEVTHQADVRLIASANCDLDVRIQEGDFRADLYYRLYILSVHMPPLREREGDIDILIDHFVAQFDHQYNIGFKTLSPQLLSMLNRFSWPGNVRELENLIHRLYLCSADSVMGVESLDDGSLFKVSGSSVCVKDESVNGITNASFISNVDDGNYDFSRDKRIAIEYFEQEYVGQVMLNAKGNVTLAAKMCGKERRAFGKLVKKYGIKKDKQYFEMDEDEMMNEDVENLSA